MDSREKIKSREDLARILTPDYRKNRKIGFTSGAFDILHSGHLDYLEKARSECDVLIVAVNSDRSIREYKSKKRPVIPQAARSRLIAGLTCADHVFVFDEKNNNKNIEILKPDIYFKAADYEKKSLSSAPLVEAYGGEVKLVPMTEGFSTTAVIEDVLYRFGSVIADPLPDAPKEKKPAVFLDRDGTINVLIDYLHEAPKFKLIDGALQALKALQDAGYRLIVITNQPGIGLGYFTKEDLFAVNKAFLSACAGAGVSIDKIYFCPHSKSENCECRKPAIGMILRAEKELNLDISKSFMIGDMTSDILLGKNAGCTSVLVQTGQGGNDGIYDVKPDIVAKDLKQAAEVIVAKSRS